MYTTCQTVTASKAGQTGDGIIRNTRDKKTLRLPATRTVAAVLQKPCGFLARQLYRPESDGLASRMVSLLAPLLSDVTLTLESSVTSIPSLCLQHTSTEQNQLQQQQQATKTMKTRLFQRFDRALILRIKYARVKVEVSRTRNERRIPELIPVLGSQSAGDRSHKPGGRLPLLNTRAHG